MTASNINQLVKMFTRKKVINTTLESGLSKCLSTLDLIVLGIGSTLGMGVYLLAGEVAQKSAGPAVIISFAIAAVASMIAGLCYAEFGARVPKAGSAYVYTYVTIGEFMAFIIGWTLILEYIIGAASVVRGLSDNIDKTLLNNTMQTAFKSVADIEIEFLSPYPDFFAFAITMAFTIAVAFGAKESSLLNNWLTFINLAVVLFVIVAGSLKADVNNWKLQPKCTADKCPHGKGGFAPYGIAGIMRGGAKCFYAFIGFDCVATASEEAKNAKKSIPIAIVASLTIVFLAYFGVSVILTTVLPYYAQEPSSPIPHMFDSIGWSWAKWLVVCGSICAMCASILGAVFPLPRVVYSMASDGLIFKWMGAINPRFHTPVLGTLSVGFITGVFATILDFDKLSNMMSIGTLLAYSIVAACVLILRYQGDEEFERKDKINYRTMTFIVKQLVNGNQLKNPTAITSQIVTSLVFVYFLFCSCTTAFLAWFSSAISNAEIWAIIVIVILVILLVMNIFFIYCQPVSHKKLTFSVPLVPFIPALSIFINLYLMMMLDGETWLRFIVWILIGLVIYFSYGIWNSTQRIGTIKLSKTIEDESNGSSNEITSDNS